MFKYLKSKNRTGFEGIAFGSMDGLINVLGVIMGLGVAKNLIR